MIVLILLSQIYAFQNDWSGGPGVQGPVPAWGNRFWQSQNINYANPGILSLVAVMVGFSNWQKHTIDWGGWHHYQGFQTFDIDNDGDKDLVLLSDETVRWYEFVANWTYVPHDIVNLGTLTWDGYAGIWPGDFDGDGDGDVVVADAGSGDPDGSLVFCRNNGATWSTTTLTTSSRSRVLAADFDGDGDLDLISSNRNWWDLPGIWYYQNDGSGNFTESVIYIPAMDDVWRLAIGDLDGDLDLDFVATACQWGGTWANVFMNNGAGVFTRFQVGPDLFCVDGMWLNDIDRDGDLDITLANYDNPPNPFEALLNDGTGLNYNLQVLSGAADNYTDGSIARDMDLDGLPDIVGSYLEIGYFRQSAPWPTFTEYWIDTCYNSHWVFPDDLDQISCTPDIDILATCQGEHTVYENRMIVSFAPLGWLESSIMQLHAVADSGGAISYLGWGYASCIPNDTAAAIYWRGGNTVAEILAAGWIGPIFLPAGTGADSIFIGTPCIKYFQYRIELRGDAANNEIATQGGIWIKYTSCPLSEEIKEDIPPSPSVFRMAQKAGVLVLELPGPTSAKLSLYDATGRLAGVLHEGNIGPGIFEFRPDFPAGVYMAVFRSPERTASAKVLIR